jgi:hypothetical protein
VIVLDEHLKKTGVQEAVSRWYRGRVCNVTELRRGTLVKDEIIPVLLRTVAQPTFVTLNWPDFWPETMPHRGFCLVCFTMHPNRVEEVPFLLRRLLRLPAFKTKAARMGKVVRVSGDQVTYRQARDPQTYLLRLP